MTGMKNRGELTQREQQIADRAWRQAYVLGIVPAVVIGILVDIVDRVWPV